MNVDSFDEYLVKYDEALQQDREDAFFDESPVPEAWKDRFEKAQENVRALNRFWRSHSDAKSISTLGTLDALSRIERFEIRRELGRGGFGIVYLAWDRSLEREVAMKVPRIDCVTDSQVRERIVREGKLAASLSHPHIVPILEAIPFMGYCCMISKLCEGGNLSQYLRANQLSIRQSAELMICLADAIAYCHERGVVHRDIKPANIMLTESPCGSLPFTPLLADFGLAKPWTLSDLTGSSSVFVGTPEYMAPEQIDKQFGSVGPRTDIYGLGCIGYELLHGQPAIHAQSLIDAIDRIRDSKPIQRPIHVRENANDLDTICLKCLEKHPANRYPNATALSDDLRRFLNGDRIDAKPRSAIQSVIHWCKQRQRFRDVGLTVMATNIVIIGSMSITNILATVGYIPTPISKTNLDPRISSLLIVGFLHVPLVFAGLAIIRQQSWGILFSLVSGFMMTGVFTAFMLGIIPEGSQMWDDIPGFRVVYSAMSMLVYLQTLASSIALLAMLEKRRLERYVECTRY